MDSIFTYSLKNNTRKIFTSQHKWLVIDRTSQRFLLLTKSDSSI
nr:MAG TPA: hypothetical protein [Caudoviricetes sp.]